MFSPSVGKSWADSLLRRTGLLVWPLVAHSASFVEKFFQAASCSTEGEGCKETHAEARVALCILTCSLAELL